MNQTMIPMSELGPRGFSGQDLVGWAQHRYGRVDIGSVDSGPFTVEFLSARAMAWRMSWEGRSWLRVELPLRVVEEATGRRTLVSGRLVSPGEESGAFLEATGCIAELRGRRRISILSSQPQSTADPLFCLHERSYRDPVALEFTHHVEADFYDGREPIPRQSLVVLGRKSAILGEQTWLVEP